MHREKRHAEMEGETDRHRARYTRRKGGRGDRARHSESTLPAVSAPNKFAMDSMRPKNDNGTFLG